MAKPTTAAGSKLSIWLGNAASPEVFAAPCGLTTRGINFSASSNDIDVPDCESPDDPAWVERVVKSLQAGVTGSGVLAKEALDTWESFFFDAVAKNCRVIIDWGAGVTRRYDGAFICSSWNVTGVIGNKIQVELKLDSDGEITPVSTP